MEKKIISICHIILFILLILTVNDYGEIILGGDFICFVGILVYLLVKYRNTYIPIKTILFWILCVIMQIFAMIIIGFKPDAGGFGLGPGPFATLFHFMFNIFYPVIFIIINLIKWCKNMFIKIIKK